jgi:hypothetical protein
MPREMKLAIKDSKTVKQIQEEFNSMFPNLKIEFFSKPHNVSEGSEKRYMRMGNKTLSQCRTVHVNGSLDVIPTMTVAELEKKFQDTYGLSAQVFRRSGKVWLETTNTDHWTLAQHVAHVETIKKGNLEV